MISMPYLEWQLLFNAFGIKLFRCYECGSIYLRFNNTTKRIHGESCLMHSSHHTHLTR